MTARAPRAEEPQPVSAAEARAYRLRRHHLLDRGSSLVEVVEHVCGIQAQVTSAANLSARARVEQLAPGEIDRALWGERSLVRTWCLRSTVHVVASRDVPMLGGALAERARRDRGRWASARGLTSDDVAALVRDVVEGLEDAPMTYADLRKRLVAALPKRVSHACDQTAVAQLVQTACLEGTLLSGPPTRGRTTFVRAERWIPGAKRMPVREAQDALLRRYLHTYAPATMQDFASWAGLAARDVQPAWDRSAVAGETVNVTVDGHSGRMLRDDLPALRAMSLETPNVRLVPAFDVYLLAHRDKSLLVSPAHYGRIYRRAGRVSPVLLVDGVAAGIWSCKSAGGRLRMRVEPFDRIPRAVRAGIDTEAADISRFLGLPVELAFGRIASPSFMI